MNILTTPNGTQVHFYSTAKEAPVGRYNEMQKYMLMESGIGSDFTAINSHFNKLDGFLAQGDIENARIERENLHYCCSSILKGSNYSSLSFACMVERISIPTPDGPPVVTIYQDMSEEGIKACANALEALQIAAGDIDDAVEEIKKKL